MQEKKDKIPCCHVDLNRAWWFLLVPCTWQCSIPPTSIQTLTAGCKQSTGLSLTDSELKFEVALTSQLRERSGFSYINVRYKVASILQISSKILTQLYFWDQPKFRDKHVRTSQISLHTKTALANRKLFLPETQEPHQISIFKKPSSEYLFNLRIFAYLP